MNYSNASLEVEVKMTWAFDTIQEFLAHIKTVKDPELFATAIQYIQRLMGEVHEVDHTLFGNDNKIAKALDGTSAYKAIRDFNEKAKKGRK